LGNLSERVDEPIGPNKLEFFVGVLFLLFALFLFINFQIIGYNQDIKYARMSALEESSNAHAFIVSNYRRCIMGRGQNHVTCVGSVAKSAEIKGFEIDTIRKVVIDIESVNAHNQQD
jgi:hypothetical protein